MKIFLVLMKKGLKLSDSLDVSSRDFLLSFSTFC
jgi:hypothetical protein